jgi:hypothetical protein
MKNPVRDMPPLSGRDPKEDVDGRRELREGKEELRKQKERYYQLEEKVGWREASTTEQYKLVQDLMGKRHMELNFILPWRTKRSFNWVTDPNLDDFGVTFRDNADPSVPDAAEGFRIVRSK